MTLIPYAGQDDGEIPLDGPVPRNRLPLHRRSAWTSLDINMKIVEYEEFDYYAKQINLSVGTFFRGILQELLHHEPDTLYRLLNRIRGMPSRRRPDSFKRWSPAEAAKALAMRKAGKSTPEIASALERTFYSVRNKIQSMEGKRCL